MPVNRNALIRYKTIDHCLRNRRRRWTLEDLIEACSEALYEYEGIDKGVSKRSIQADIQMMRSEKLGYNAPIVVLEKKYYTYEDPEYSITNIPLSDHDMNTLSEILGILKQFKGFSHFNHLDGMVHKLEDYVYVQKENKRSVIDFEKNELLRGLEHLDTIYQAIVQEQVLEITYQSFKATEAHTFKFHAYLLKEYKNRWFVIGIQKKGQPILNLALDRIKLVRVSLQDKYLVNTEFSAEAFYAHAVGVTVIEGMRPDKIELRVDKHNAPYVETKPIHPSQTIVERYDDGSIRIALKVIINYELEREILGFGDSMIVLKPERLKKRIIKKMEKALQEYAHLLDYSEPKP
ncbi:MAG: WYL domain-containing protein [Cytophagaceae bacterium]|jgi:predicted DNA-binding transcriptional regulator YafY|nr:WYL domain-containing protein [Cytophagaceae bacterium]